MACRLVGATGGIWLIETLGTNFSEILTKILTFLFKKMHFKIPSAEMAAILSRTQCVNND